MKLTKTCARFLRKNGGTLLAIGACAKNSLEFRGFIGQLTKAKLAEVWGVDRTSAVFLRVHGYTPLLYLCGTGMDTFS